MKKINKILKYLSVISFKTFSEHEWAIYALFFILDMLASEPPTSDWNNESGCAEFWMSQQLSGFIQFAPVDFSRHLFLARSKLLRLRYTERLAAKTFSAAQHYNIVTTLFPIVAILFQHCNVFVENRLV